MSISLSPLILVQADTSGGFESRSVRDTTRDLLSGRLDYEALGKLGQEDRGILIPQLFAALDNYYGSVLGFRGRVYEGDLNAAISAKTELKEWIDSIDPHYSTFLEASIAAVYFRERLAGGLPSLFIEETDAIPETRFSFPEPEYSTIPIPGDLPEERKSRRPLDHRILKILPISLFCVLALILLATHYETPSSSEDLEDFESVKETTAEPEGVVEDSDEPRGVKIASPGTGEIPPRMENPVPTEPAAAPPAAASKPTVGSPPFSPTAIEKPEGTEPSVGEALSAPGMEPESGQPSDKPATDSEPFRQAVQLEGVMRADSLLAEFQKNLDAHEREFDTEKTLLDQQYIQALKREEERQISNGDINAIKILREEMKSVEEEGKESTSLAQLPRFLAENRSKYQQLVDTLSRDKAAKLIELKGQILSELASIQEEMTRDGQIEEALRARDLIADLRERENPVPVETTPEKPLLRAEGFQFAQVQRTLLATRSIANLSVADANGDQRPDLLGIDIQSAQIHFFEQRNPLIFEPSRDFLADQTSPQSRWRSVGIADLDGDGQKELLVSNSYRDSALLLERKFGLSGFSERENSGLELVPTYAPFVFGDINGDGSLDICVYNVTSPQQGEFPLFYANDGTGRFRALEISAPWKQVSRVEDIQLLDFDLDADLDLVLVDESGLKVFRNEGGGEFVPVTAEIGLFQPVSSSGAWGDVDSDGDLDVVVSFRSGDNCSLFLQGEDGRFQSGRWSVSGSADSLALADFNGDGHLDLLRADAKESRVLVYPNDAEKGFGNPTDISPRYVSPSGLIATVSDIDGDTDEDIVLSNWGVGIEILENESNHKRNTSLVIVAETPERPNPDGAIVKIFSADDRQFQQMRVINSGTSQSLGQRDAVFHGVTEETIVEVVFPGGESVSRKVFPAPRRQSVSP